jgi:gliding motility-associated-like protein
MNKHITLILLFVSLFFFGSERAMASHAVGAEVTYQYMGPNQYMVTVKFYRDCGGQAAALPTTDVDVDYNSSCGNGTATLPAIPGTGLEIPTGQYPPCAITTCNGGSGYGVQEWVYQGIITLPSACTDWNFSVTIYARNDIITTIDMTTLPSLYVESTLNNTSNLVDSSPVFSHPPVARFCTNHPFNYDQGATDPDGDSLVYSLVDALQGPGAVVPYITPYSGANPIASSPPVTINSQTGLITLNPTQVQIGVIAILVEEYRNGVLIGSVRRDIQVNIEAQCNFPPQLDSNTTFNNITAHCLDTVLYIHLSSPVRCNTIAGDGTDFRLIDPYGQAIPTLIAYGINCSGNPAVTDSILLVLFHPLWDNGTYHVLSKIGNDGNTLLSPCGTPMPEFDTVSFTFLNCYPGIVDLTNVSVDFYNNNMEISWRPPTDTIWSTRFQSFDIFRGDTPDGNYNLQVGTVTDSSQTTFTDATVNVPVQPYNYRIKVHLNTGYIGPFSDSIQSIFMNGTLNADSATISLWWTPYWGWANPSYQVMLSDDAGLTFEPVSGASTSGDTITFDRPGFKGKYLARIESTNGSLLARSNWFAFDIAKLDVVAPNVFTPNGDGKNDTFFFENLDNYPNSALHVFNRWGRKIYETANYMNDWKGEDYPEGVYYYTLKVTDKKSTEMSGTVTLIRNKK